MEKHQLTHVFREIKKLEIEIESIIDVGAYRGEFTSKAKRFFPNLNFLLIEPNTAHSAKLKGDDISQFVVSTVLSDSAKTVDFYALEETGDSYYPERRHLLSEVTSKKVETTTLDNVLNSRPNFTGPFLIKLDTQGSEIDILKGARECLKETNVVICEIPVLRYNLGAPTFNEYIDFFLNLNFLPWRISEVHTRKNLVIQIDVVFLSKGEFDKKLNLDQALKVYFDMGEYGDF
jgi:FkbM family methyltransferase